MDDNQGLWDDPDLLIDTGVVAVDESWAQLQGLPISQHWPWDRTKGIYIINAYHNLHCVLLLRQSVQRGFSGESQEWSEHHLLHCLDVLREDIMCTADDTLRYTGRVNDQANAKIPHSGYGQERRCRDWTKLHEWAVEHSACYQAGANGSDLSIPETERYKHCPDGAMPWDKI